MPRGFRAGGGGMRSGGGSRGGGFRSGGFRSSSRRGFRASPSFSRRGSRRTIHHRPTGFHRHNRYGGWYGSPWHRRRYSYWGYRSTTGGSIIAVLIIMFFVVPIFFGIFFAAFSLPLYNSYVILTSSSVADLISFISNPPTFFLRQVTPLSMKRRKRNEQTGNP